MTRIAVAGAGLIGKRHAAALAAAAGAELACLIDPASGAAEVAAEHGVALYPSLDAALEKDRPEGVILATPNALHKAGALACIAAGLPVLVEKPLATTLDDARAIVEAGEASGVPVLTGHHRRHNPLIAAARAHIEAGTLGRIVAVHAMFWLEKPAPYFDTQWRREAGAGPVYLNLSHDIDLMRHLVGDVVTVQAVESHSVRGNAVEDAAAILLTFANGALGTVSITDAVPAPWSWELASGENPAYPPTRETCYWIGGTKGALDLPGLGHWAHPGDTGWMTPLARTQLLREQADPLVRQAENFAAAIRGEAQPVVSAREGFRTLAVIEAVKRAAATGRKEEPEA